MSNVKTEKAIEMVNGSVASIFTKEDVIKLIKSIDSNEPETNEQEETRTITLSDYEEMLEKIHSAIDNSMESEFGSMDINDATFYLEGNTIEIDSVSIDRNPDVVYDEVENIVNKYIKF